ncbi:hypothetical protein [Flavobacterium gilvum]|uniref:Vitellogenin II n=1 Tax=Flavobacterium gilvum TaxID=1492737 RepID=A0AAC9N7S0_9FLAO|nr:hypothetical protein [Flavobacterium gilvum]AOW10963.1 hypothetical protein EM308_16550 [Flavobacterium gilvum]KFC60738.1 hypothetical protein FEM08_05030 [Flavobacterium gilvum]
MKTKTLITRKRPLYFLLGFLGLAVTSCGSYQNSSYYDNDGVYNTNGEKVVIKDNQQNSSSVQYKQYFNSLQNTSGNSDEIFTDVNSYGSNYNVGNDSIQAPSTATGYASWGSNPDSTTVVVYSDPFWYGGYYGWGYPYYGYGYPYYGWGYYPGWGYPGWGYPGWGYPGCGYPGWGHPGYGYPIATPYAYNYSRRGSDYGGNYNNYTNRVTPYSRTDFSGRNSIYNGAITNRASTYNRNSVNSLTSRTSPTFTNRNSSASYRNYSNQTSRGSYTEARNSSSGSYQRSSSYTPSSNSTYRGSSSNMSSGGSARMSSGGGGYSGGGGMSGGGGRMSGGGGRR